MKGHMVLGDITPRTKSNMLETFVFLDILIILLIKVLKNILNMPKCLVVPASNVM